MKDELFSPQVGAAEPGIAPIRSRYATLTVLVPPDAPRIRTAAPAAAAADGAVLLEAVEGQTLEVECVSEGGKPASEVSEKSLTEVIINLIFVTDRVYRIFLIILLNLKNNSTFKSTLKKYFFSSIFY